MGITLHCMKKYLEASEIFLLAISDREKAIGSNDRVSSRTGALYYVLGNLRTSQTLLDESYSLHHRAFLQCRQTAGVSAYATLKCSQRLAEHYKRYLMYTEAR
jgi:hypothetical protein